MLCATERARMRMNDEARVNIVHPSRRGHDKARVATWEDLRKECTVSRSQVLGNYSEYGRQSGSQYGRMNLRMAKAHKMEGFWKTLIVSTSATRRYSNTPTS